MTRDEVMSWVRTYEERCRAEEARYLRGPYAAPLEGHAAIGEFWSTTTRTGPCSR